MMLLDVGISNFLLYTNDSITGIKLINECYDSIKSDIYAYVYVHDGMTIFYEIIQSKLSNACLT